LELILLTVLLWQRGVAKDQVQGTETLTSPVDIR
jgi:hypothetical protein